MCLNNKYMILNQPLLQYRGDNTNGLETRHETGLKINGFGCIIMTRQPDYMSIRVF